MNKIRFMTQAAVIAAMYAALTIYLAPFSYGAVQLRVAEALTVLPVITPAAIPGLFIGCIVANLVGGYGPIDVIFGSLATLIAALLSYKMPKRFLVPLPPVIINAIVIGFVLYFTIQAPLLATMLSIGIGQAVACYALGYPLMIALDRVKGRFIK